MCSISLISPRQSGTSYNDGLEVSGSSGTVIGSQDVVDLAGGDNLHIGGDGKDGVYVVVDASDGQVSLANNNSYLGTTQIASGTLMVSDNSQLEIPTITAVIFTDKQQESVMEITSDVDTRSDAAGHGRDIEMRADGEVAVDAGVDTQWGALMADSSGQHQDEGSTLTKTGAGTLELTASGTTQSAVRVEEGTLKVMLLISFLMLRHCGLVMGQRSLLARIRIFSQLMLFPAALSTSAMVRFCA